MVAFLTNTPETLGWLFTNLTQAPVLLQAVRDECNNAAAVSSNTNFKQATPYLYSALFETCRLYVFTGTPATVVRPCTLPGTGDHVFQPGDILHAMGAAAALDVDVYGPDARLWKGHRFVGEKGEGLLKYDLTFGIGRSRRFPPRLFSPPPPTRLAPSPCFLYIPHTTSKLLWKLREKKRQEPKKRKASVLADGSGTFAPHTTS